MAEPRLDTPPNAFGGYDIFSSSRQSKEFGFNRFQESFPELAQSDAPTRDMLLRIHSLITPDMTVDYLHPTIKTDMELGLMLLDRPDMERVSDISEDVFKKVSKRGQYEQLRPVFNDTRLEIKQQLSRFTDITLQPTLKGGLRSYGSRQIEGYDPEPIVYASHTLVMAGEGHLLAIQLGQPDIIFPDSYYGLSTGLPEVYTALCDKYDAALPASTQPDGIFLREAFFQVLGTRLLHPFWDGNGRAFTGQLAVSLAKQKIPTDLPRLQQASVMLGSVGDRMVELVLKNAELSLVTDRPGQSLNLAMWLNPHMRNDYMTRLKTEIERAIDIADKPGNDYHNLILHGRNILRSKVEG